MISLNVSVELMLKQVKYCLTNNLPSYAPKNGICPNCRTSIYEDKELLVGGISKGYTAEDAEKTHIKQCPHCMYVFKE